MKPELILLDEPAAGLTVTEVRQLAERISQLRKEGITVFIVEHHMGMIMEVADEVAVLDSGRLIAVGRPDAVSSDPRVIEAYLKGAKVDA